MNPKVSIIIPVYNVEKYLEQCVKSALSQTYKNLEIILVDDGSTDNSSKICTDFASKHKKIVYYYKENGGVSSARNLGIEKASGKYVFFLDADDKIDEIVIENLVSNIKCCSLSSSRTTVLNDKKKWDIKRSESYKAKEIIEKILINELQGFIFGYLLEKDKCPKFNEETGYCEDFLFLVDYIQNNDIEEITFLSKECGVYYYVQNNDSVTNRSTGVLKKLKDIELSMLLLNKKTNNKYSESIKNKENELFEAELQRISRADMKKAFELFKLPVYSGKSLRLKFFSKLYKKKNLNKLICYYKIRKIIKRIVG